MFLASCAWATDFIGRASVIDGDTIEISGEGIRLHGIDAPESWQICKDANNKPYRCGKIAADALDRFLAKSRPTICEARGRDRYRRVVADCSRSDGVLVNAWLVEQGYAVDWVRYSRGEYAEEQRSAQKAKRGIWQGPFDMPYEARAKNRKTR